MYSYFTTQNQFTYFLWCCKKMTVRPSLKGVVFMFLSWLVSLFVHCFLLESTLYRTPDSLQKFMMNTCKPFINNFNTTTWSNITKHNCTRKVAYISKLTLNNFKKKSITSKQQKYLINASSINASKYFYFI